MTQLQIYDSDVVTQPHGSKANVNKQTRSHKTCNKVENMPQKFNQAQCWGVISKSNAVAGPELSDSSRLTQKMQIHLAQSS